MDDRKAYWFEQPHMPGIFNVAIQPIVDPRDGRLHFAVPDSGIWALTGKVIKDTGDYFEFECNDSVMGARGGTYKFSALDIKTFRKETWKWIAQGKDIAECCQNTADLHFWYRKNWPNSRVAEIGAWEMEENRRKGHRTDIYDQKRTFLIVKRAKNAENVSKINNNVQKCHLTQSVWKNPGAFFMPKRRRKCRLSVTLLRAGRSRLRKRGALRFKK